MLRVVGLVVMVLLIRYAVRQLGPSRFGLAFGLLLLYIPVHHKVPLNALGPVNALTMSVFVLLVLRPSDGDPLLRHARTFRMLAVAFCGLSAFGLVLTLSAEPGQMSLLLTYFKRWIDPVIFGVLALALRKDEDRKFAVAMMVIGYAIVAVHGIREGIDYGPNKRIPGLLGHPNETGAFLAMYAPVGLAFALLILRGWRRLVLVGITVLGAVALVPTLSRASWTGYGLGIIVLLFAAGRRGAAICGLAVGLALYVAPDLLPERVTARFEETVNEEATTDGLEDNLDESAASRITQWKASIDAMSANPIGFGLGRFKDVISAYGGIPGLDAHNQFFLVGVELGVAGFVMATVLFWKMGTNTWALARGATDPFTASLAAACCATVVAAFVVNSFGSRLMQVQPSTYLWVLMAIVVRARDTMERAAEAAPIAATPFPSRFSRSLMSGGAS
jgi:cell division protein FtsW (lipid II flippase)